MTTTVDDSRISATAEEMAFINRIIENPDDDAPRLVFADWLEENGKDASYIRDQVSLRTIKGARSYSRLSSPYLKNEYCGWREGFIEIVHCTAEWWLANADEMTTYHPIRHVTLTTWPQFDEMEKFLSSNGWMLSRHASAMDHFLGYGKVFWPNITFTLPGEQ